MTGVNLTTASRLQEPQRLNDTDARLSVAFQNKR